jgi:hypothetical protein
MLHRQSVNIFEFQRFCSSALEPSRPLDSDSLPHAGLAFMAGS